MIVIVKDYFQEIFDLEHSLEQHRKELSYQRDFTLIGAFNTFAKSMQQRVTLEEFSFGLDRMDFALLPSDIKLFFDRYDSDQDGKLGFWEFSNSLLPIDIRQRDDLENRQQGYEMTFETKTLFKRVLSKAIELEVQVEKVRTRVKQNLGAVSTRQMFEEIDWLNRGHITKIDIKRIIDQYSQYVSAVTADQRSHPDSIEMEALVKRFNKDKATGRISLPEWVEELTPKLR